MTGNMGLSFAPTGNNELDKANGANQTPIQDAIKVLSLRMPFNVGSGGITPLAGMAGGAAGLPNVGGIPGGLEDLLRRLFASSGMGAPSVPGQPAPPPMRPPGPVVTFPETQGPEVPPGLPGRMPPMPGPGMPRAPIEKQPGGSLARLQQKF